MSAGPMPTRRAYLWQISCTRRATRRRPSTRSACGSPRPRSSITRRQRSSSPTDAVITFADHARRRVLYRVLMEPTGTGPDDVTRAALEAVSEATDLAQREQQQRRVPPRQRFAGRARDRLRRRAAKRADRTRGERQIRATLSGAARRGFSAGSRWLSAQVLAMAPRLPVRDLATLRAQFPDRSPDELASALIEGASRASAAVGVAVGAWAVLPFLPAAGAEILTETLSVVGIEIKLVAELHEVYGQRAPGNVVERMTAYVGAWASKRGVALAPGGLVLAARSPLARQLRRRLAARAGRSIFSLGPLLTGAAAGGLINRRETRKLGRLLADDLRKRSPYGSGWPY